MTKLLHEAGAPRTALQFLPGGRETGAALVSAPETGGVAFTGSTAAAKKHPPRDEPPSCARRAADRRNRRH